MDTSIIDAIGKIDRRFTKDCYFYYIVPEEHLKNVAEWFDDRNWKTYSSLSTAERNAYRSRMCRSDSSDDDDDYNAPPAPSGSEVYDEDVIGWNAVMSPWSDCKFRTVTDVDNLIWLINTFRYVIIFILLSVLLKI